MQTYNDIDGDSNIEAFEIEDDSITVRFFDGSTYLYTYQSSGSLHVEEMKRLACNHDGLNAYISKYKPPYARKY